MFKFLNSRINTVNGRIDATIILENRRQYGTVVLKTLYGSVEVVNHVIEILGIQRCRGSLILNERISIVIDTETADIHLKRVTCTEIGFRTCTVTLLLVEHRKIELQRITGIHSRIPILDFRRIKEDYTEKIRCKLIIVVLVIYRIVKENRIEIIIRRLNEILFDIDGIKRDISQVEIRLAEILTINVVNLINIRNQLHSIES